MFDHSIRHVLRFLVITIYEKFYIPPNLVGNLSFDNISLETDITNYMTFKGKRSGVILNFTLDVDPA